MSKFPFELLAASSGSTAPNAMQRKRHTSWQRRPRWHLYAVVGVEGEDARVDARMLKDDRVKAKKNHSIFTMDLDEEAALLDF
ncbi:hypothetical protein D9757_011423 [Collybiopsis confluens]|uniref:Uncharacterized protein n=1 Tax=Collybiopsis confluens TaxID=2823264 RepID=A0A8H5GHR4_9AGAR|nr:hypothetical protein D9757_011423 [Collybiopsis confluens]